MSLESALIGLGPLDGPRDLLVCYVCVWGVQDVYELPQKMGKYLTIPRTEGVSTTDIGTNTSYWVD